MWGDLPKKNESSSDNKDLDHLAIGGAVLFVVGIACLLTVKYFPILVLGLSIGFLIYAAKFHESLGAKVKGALFTVAFFALLYFLLFGIPLNYPWRWQGALFYSKSFCNLCVFSNQWWNNLVPDFLKKFRIFKISELMVTQYVWLSFYLGLIVSAILFGLSIFGKLGSEISEIGLKIASVPAFLFSKLLDLLFGFWVKLGWSVTQDFGLPASALLITLSSGTAYLMQSRLAGRIPAFEFQWALSHFVYLVPVGVVLGIGLRFIPGNSTLIDFLLGIPRKQTPSEKPGFLLGKTFSGKPFRLTERNLHYHVEIVAPTGSGKTNLLQNLIADRITKGHGVIFLDYKAEFDGVSWMYRVAKSVNREKEIRLFSLSNPDLSVPYNPLKFGDHSDIQSALMNAMSWSESFYRNLAGMTLITLIRGLCEYRDKTGELFHLGHLYEFLDQPGKLRVFSEILVSNGCPSAASISELAARLEKPSERNNHMGLISNLNQLLFSSAGSLLSHDTIHGSFDFREAIGEGRIVYGLMNSLKLKESASVVGKILLQDLMSFVGEHYAQVEQKTHRPITLVIDEFASFATPQFIEFMDRARGAGIGIVISHQARADLKSISPEFQERVEANANTTLVSGIKNSSDAEHYSGMLGTQTTKKETVQKKQGVLWDDETGMKSVREVEEYVLHPNRLKELKLGEVFAVSRTVDPKWGMIKVPRVADFREYEASTQELISHFKTTRETYQKQKEERYFDLERLHAKRTGLKTELSESGAGQTSETWK